MTQTTITIGTRVHRLAHTSVRGPRGPAVPLSDTQPAPLGTVAPGVSTEASRADHVHPMPSLTVADVTGAVGTTDPRLSDARTPTAHTHPQYTTALNGKAPGIDVRAFGAVADGVTDDYPAIQAALTFAGSDATKVVHLPAGIYMSSNTLLVPSGVTLRGDGPESVIVNPPGDLPGVSVGGYLVYASVSMCSVSGACVRDLCVDHFANATDANGVHVGNDAGATYSTNCVVERVTVKGYATHQYCIWNHRARGTLIRGCTVIGNVSPYNAAPQEAIEVYGGEDVRILDNTVSGTGGNCIYVWEDNISGSETSVKNIHIAGNIVSGAGYGISVVPYSTCADIIIARNVVSSAHTAGISVVGDAANVSVSRIIIADNVVSGTYANGIAVDSQGSAAWSAVSVTGNIVCDSGSAGLGGIYVAAPGVVVSGNVVYDTHAQAAIYINSPGPITILENYIDGSDKNAITVDSLTTKCLVARNRCVGYNAANAGYYGILNTGVGTTVEGNSLQKSTGSSETYAIYSVGASLNLRQNAIEYVAGFASPFYAQGAGVNFGKVAGVGTTGGLIRGPEYTGTVSFDAKYLESDIPPAQFSQNWYNAAVDFSGYVFRTIDSASGAAANVCQWFGGGDGTTRLVSIDKHGGVRLREMTVAELASYSPPEGTIAYATNGRKSGEGAGAGTGVLVYYSAGKWRVYRDDSEVQA